MKNPQKGSTTAWVIIIIVIILLGIGAYYYFQNNGTTGTSQAAALGALQASTTAPTTPAQSPAPVVSLPPGVQNCGEVTSTTSDAVYSCMSQAIVTCSPAGMTQTLPDGSGTKILEIVGTSGAYCRVGEATDVPPAQLMCNIPSSFISNLNKYLTSKSQQGTLFDGIPFFFLPPSTPTAVKPPIKDPVTGKTVTAQCSFE